MKLLVVLIGGFGVGEALNRRPPKPETRNLNLEPKTLRNCSQASAGQGAGADDQGRVSDGREAQRGPPEARGSSGSGSCCLWGLGCF